MTELWTTSGGQREVEAALRKYLPTCRWFGGKARTMKEVTVESVMSLGEAPEAPGILLLRVEYESGAGETYSLPIKLGEAGSEGAMAVSENHLPILDGTGAESFQAAVMELIAGGKSIALAEGVLRGERGPGMPAEAEQLPSRLLKVEQSNSSLLYGDQIFVKLFRKLEDGMNPDVEITRYLNEQGCEQVPPFAGALLLERPGREAQVLALALGMVPNQGDAWAQTLHEVRAFYERVRASGDSPALADFTGGFEQRVRQLGVRTSEVHRALAAAPEGHPFAAEAFKEEDQRALAAGIRNSVEEVFGLLEQAQDPLARQLAARQGEVLQRAAEIETKPLQTRKTRTHGDYHLGQVLNTGEDYVIIDFEGEPQRSLAERQQKRSPLRDVAGMLRSFHYAAHSGLGEFEAERERLTPWAEKWAALMSQTFLQAWREAGPGERGEDEDRLLQAYLLEKAVYEAGYELNNRPTWVGIPVRGILQILGG